MKLFINLIIACSFCSYAIASDRYILLGGGPFPASSEASIESNVEWIRSLLDARNISNYDIVFASGKDNIRDVKVAYQPDPLSLRWLRVARVYNKHKSLFEYYRENSVAVDQRVATDTLVKSLFDREVGALGSGDNLMVIYNGHGGYEPGNIDDNHLRLWGETRHTVRDLSETLQEMDSSARFRFVFPQCFSGAYTNLIYEDIDHKKIDKVATNRCGFTPVDAHKPSEGCRPDLNIDDYRDYSNFFFAAIDGQMRTGTPLNFDPDTNTDGKVSLREAHFYAVTEAYSRSVPRTTSEVYLEEWEPWYLRWLPKLFPDESSSYHDVLRRLTHTLSFQHSLGQLGFWAELYERRQNAERGLKDVAERLSAELASEKRQRRRVKEALERNWPEFINPFDNGFVEKIQTELDAVDQWLNNLDDFNKLESYQIKIDNLEVEHRSKERDLGMVLRIYRSLKMANLEKQIAVYGSDTERRDYEAFLTCERYVLPNNAN